MADVAYIALGSNLGDRDAHLAAARAALAAIPRSRVVAASTVEETAPLGPPGQGAYLNQMIALETALTPAELLGELQEIERRAGRVRDVRWGPRTIDLDIVTMRDQCSSDERCSVPHPELPNRDFWQRELAELQRVEFLTAGKRPMEGK
ncbi:MAG TPA: 2-amino-4-hydroxy-6-hydroxymethyldihydropteridine diphosphokinase [Gemmatimonadaceae bacterium]|nr:2-amino-4-hydroxy-6-hydroxymethyldihydropteridine diphosphokinase [Gemmatimonadaceae bacterium]